MTVFALPRAVYYSGNGVTTTFPVPFQFYEINVYLGNTLQPTTAYSITQTQPGSSGSVTFNTAPGDDVNVVIVGKTSIIQEADYVEGDPFPAEVHEAVLDRLTMVAQELNERVNDGDIGNIPDVSPDFALSASPNANVVTIVGNKSYMTPLSNLFSINNISPLGRTLNVGDIVPHVFEEVPAGWIRLKSTPQPVLKSLYPEYTAKCEAEGWPYGHDSTTVNVPAISAFIRAWDDSGDGGANPMDPDSHLRFANGSGDSAPHAIGSRQLSQNKAHTHGPGTLAGVTNTAGEHTHSYHAAGSQVTRDSGVGNAAGPRSTQQTGSSGNHSHTVTINAGVTASQGGTDARPDNVAFPYIMLLSPGDAAAPHSVLGVPYNFDTGTEDSDPGEGTLRLDAEDPSAATYVYISKKQAFGTDVEGWLTHLDENGSTPSGILTICAVSNPGLVLLAAVNGPTEDETDYVKLPIEVLSAGSGFTDQSRLSVQLTFAGLAGSQGDPGETGAQGADGADGADGDAGWSPKYAVVSDGARRVLQLVGYVGGEGDAPTDHVGEYVGATDYVATVGEAVDVRGPAGANGTGTGTVVGPESSVAGNLAIFDDTTGELIDDSGVSVSTDGTMASDSDAKVPTEKAIRTFIGAVLAAGDYASLKGGIDCSGNPDYPAADAGDTYRVTVAGKIGGASGPDVEVGDAIQCFVDESEEGDQATVGANWIIVQTNIDDAASLLRDNVEDQGPLTGGASITPKDLGSGIGTITVDVADRPCQLIANDTGAFSLAVGTARLGSTTVIITNGASAGTITDSDFDATHGDPFTTTNGHIFRCTVEYWGSGKKWLFRERMS